MKKVKGTLSSIEKVKGDITFGVGQGGTLNDYNLINNKPQIESVELVGDKSFEDLGLSPIDAIDIIDILN